MTHVNLCMMKFDVCRRLYTTVAATDTDVLVFSADDFLEFLELYPSIKETLEMLCVSFYRF